MGLFDSPNTTIKVFSDKVIIEDEETGDDVELSDVDRLFLLKWIPLAKGNGRPLA